MRKSGFTALEVDLSVVEPGHQPDVAGLEVIFAPSQDREHRADRGQQCEHSPKRLERRVGLRDVERGELREALSRDALKAQ